MQPEHTATPEGVEDFGPAAFADTDVLDRRRTIEDSVTGFPVIVSFLNLPWVFDPRLPSWIPPGSYRAGTLDCRGW